MCNIRCATPQDLDALAEMGERFFAYSAFAGVVQFDREAVRGSLGQLLDNPQGVVLVAEIDGQIVGGIVGAMAALWFNPGVRVATELAWWVAEDHRTGTAAIKLYRAFEAWGDEQGADVTVMSDLVIDGETPAARLFERLGYATVERAHIKQRSK